MEIIPLSKCTRFSILVSANAICENAFSSSSKSTRPSKVKVKIFKSDSRFYCVYQKDIYSGEQWCEILPAKATKANAILRLKEYLSCDRVISFGDGKNDIFMEHGEYVKLLKMLD